MMPGMIMLWYGSIATIPSGWGLCDGSNGTPDLGGRFVMCTGPGYPPGNTGGNYYHTHDFTGDGHSHDLVAETVIVDDTPSGHYSHHTNTVPATGTTDESSHKPLYHALCYIMKLPIP